jgi:hypothetical protein
MASHNDQEKRFDRIEEKLDKLAEAIVSLARMEERMVTLFRRMDVYDGHQENMENRIFSVEKRVGTNGQTLRFAERLFWILVSGAVATVFFYMRG